MSFEVKRTTCKSAVELFHLQGLKHILLTIKCLLIGPNPESALNEEAGKLLLERYDEIVFDMMLKCQC